MHSMSCWVLLPYDFSCHCMQRHWHIAVLSRRIAHLFTMSSWLWMSISLSNTGCLQHRVLCNSWHGSLHHMSSWK